MGYYGISWHNSVTIMDRYGVADDNRILYKYLYIYMYEMVTTITVCYIWTSALRQGYPQPTAIYVSPLQRTLQTAAILFPEHPGIHVARSMSL
jgi:hypothetical protein